MRWITQCVLDGCRKTFIDCTTSSHPANQPLPRSSAPIKRVNLMRPHMHIVPNAQLYLCVEIIVYAQNRIDFIDNEQHILRTTAATVVRSVAHWFDDECRECRQLPVPCARCHSIRVIGPVLMVDSVAVVCVCVFPTAFAQNRVNHFDTSREQIWLRNWWISSVIAVQVFIFCWMTGCSA